jgi:hypothetical protein
MAVNTTTQKQSDEELHSAQGPHAPRRDKTPERNYPASERDTGANRTDARAPGGPVNIGVKGAPPPAGPDQARRETPGATSKGSRDSGGSLPQD